MSVHLEQLRLVCPHCGHETKTRELTIDLLVRDQYRCTGCRRLVSGMELRAAQRNDSNTTGGQP